MKLGIRGKLTLLYVLISLCTIIFVSVFFAFNLRDEEFKTVSNDYVNRIDYIDFATTNFFSEVEENVETLSLIDAVRTRDDKGFTNFLNADENNFQYNIGKTEQSIIDIFNSYRITHPYVSSVYMGRENGSFVRSHKRASPTEYDPRERPWYVLGKENPEKVVMTEPYASVTTPDINIGIEKALVDENGVVFGVVGMDVTIKSLTDFISKIKIGENGWAMLVNEKGVILASPNEKDLFQNILTLDKENLTTFMETKQGYTTFTRDSKKNYIFYDTSPSLGWKIGLIIPVEEINRVVGIFILKIVLILACALLLFSILTLVGLQKFVIRPLKRLSEVTSLIINTGKLDHFIETETQDEIGYLSKSFNKMMDSINKSGKNLQASERALRKLNDELEEKVNKRTEELARTNSQLKELDRLKSMFISSMSHELRTPLNSIIGFTSIILKGMAGKITNEQKKQLMMVKGSADHLLALITDVIDVSKIEADKVELYIEDFDLIELIREIMDSFKVIIDKKVLKIFLETPKSLIIKNDERRIKQIIMNLVSNATKYTEEGKIDVKIEKIESKVYISVADTGIGIKEEDIKNLFKQFSRIHTDSQKIVEGTGLGLYLSKKMADLLGGDIGVESVIGKGSIFTLTLPLIYPEVKK